MKKRIWNKQELTIAYYMAKYDMSGINIEEDTLIHTVIKDTSKASLRMQVANFRHLLNIEGYQLSHASQAMKDLCDEYDTKSQSEIKMLVISYIDACELDIADYTTQKANKIVNKRRDKLNSILKSNFENKLATMCRFRNLVPKLA